VNGAESESAILVPFGENHGFASNVQTQVMVIIMLWRSGRSDGLVVLVGCERNFAGSRDLERSRIGSTSDNRDVSTLDTFEQPRNKTLWSLEAAAVPAQCYHPVQMTTAFIQNSPSNHRASVISQTNQMQNTPSPRAYRPDDLEDGP
jgi:hypothetical protein